MNTLYFYNTKKKIMMTIILTKIITRYYSILFTNYYVYTHSLPSFMTLNNKKVGAISHNCESNVLRIVRSN